MALSFHMPMLAESNFLMELFLLLALVLPAWLMAAIDSPGLIPYLIAAWAFGPEVRRINDWTGGDYQNVTVLSLIPSAATGALIIPILRYMSRIPNDTRMNVVLVFMPLSYGTMMGLLFNGIGGLVEGLGFVLPFFFMLYAASQPYSEPLRNRWLRSYFVVAIAVALYGWYQYLAAPAWDMLWMMGSRMYTSVGRPEPMAFRPFSTLGAPLALGMFLAMALVVGICNKKWRGWGGTLGMMLMSTCLFLSLVRTVWIVLAAAIATITLFSKGRHRWTSVGAICVLGTGVYLLLPMLPGAESVNSRMSSFGDLNNDVSAQARLGIFGSLGNVVTSPLGRGFGANGITAKLSSSTGGVNLGFDNGYLDVGTSLGAPMTVLLIVGVIRLSRQSIRSSGVPGVDATRQTPFNVLAAAMSVAWIVSMFSFNTLGNAGGVLLWLSLGSPIGCKTKSLQNRPRRPYPAALSERMTPYGENI